MNLVSLAIDVRTSFEGFASLAQESSGSSGVVTTENPLKFTPDFTFEGADTILLMIGSLAGLVMLGLIANGLVGIIAWAGGQKQNNPGHAESGKNRAMYSFGGFAGVALLAGVSWWIYTSFGGS